MICTDVPKISTGKKQDISKQNINISEDEIFESHVSKGHEYFSFMNKKENRTRNASYEASDESYPLINEMFQLYRLVVKY